MFRHVVMFSWNDTVDAAHVAAVAAQLDGLVAVIPEIKAYLHGPDAGLNPGNLDYALLGEFGKQTVFLKVHRKGDTMLFVVRD